METEKRGFTAVECFIVVVVLGLVASVVMPKLSMAAGEARTSDLCDSLHKVRSAISLYRVQHEDNMPGAGNADWFTAMQGSTNSKGDIYTLQMDKADAPKWGPYINKVPVNVFNAMNSVRIDGPSAGQGTHGWRYDSYTGEFQADDTGVGHDIL